MASLPPRGPANSCNDFLTPPPRKRGGFLAHVACGPAGIHDRPPSEEWHFETTTVHAAGEEMRNLAAEFDTFLTGTAE
ncbi:DUF6228 family protein [Streptomyces gilvosporeus]|uniref:Uncharacterized protein n=1 Tax=Streptomyces gilvosporeus TaxID=553510 RepID=A0A1V0TIR7_9ACTN|nr:hypothetical protein B1H19_00170 [Streptomyces gilvosporeus]